jgi:hypothetical protein
MATIPNGQKILTSAPEVNTTYGGSASLQALNTWYTMGDISNTVRPYKVFTALLTQSGGDDPDNIVSGNTVIGVTYQIQASVAGDDFRNIGGPLIVSNDDFNGTYFVATGTTPNVYTNGTSLDFNTGAPVATVLENTIGNIWFTFFETGRYYANSNELFTDNKTAVFGGYYDGDLLVYVNYLSNNNSSSGIYIQTGDPIASNGYLQNTPIEIRVYN